MRHPLGVLWFLACAGDPELPEPVEELPEAPELLQGSPLLARISLDLIGRRPTQVELQRLREDPEELPILVDEYLDDPDFAGRMAWIWNDSFHTAVFADDYQRFGELSTERRRAMGMAPLMMVSLIVEQDLPFNTLVTSQQLAGQEVLADFYPIEGASTEWGWVDATDGRPMAGVLSSTSLWLRYSADATNYHRARANAVSRLMLCSDFLERESGFEFALQPEALTNTEEAVWNEGACLTCHAALDPLGAAFGGFAEKSDSLPAEQYLRWSAMQDAWQTAQLQPTYYGVPATLDEMGPLIAQDPRFSRCVVQRFHEGLVGVAPEPLQHDALTRDFVEQGLVARDLVRTILFSEAYQDAELRPLTNEQLASSLSASLGLPLEGGPLEELVWDPDLRVLSGGTDDVSVLQRSGAPSPGREAALWWAAQQAVGATALVDEEADASAEITRLYLILLSAEPDPETLAGLEALHASVGWEGVLEALIRHPLGQLH